MAVLLVRAAGSSTSNKDGGEQHGCATDDIWYSGGGDEPVHPLGPSRFDFNR